MNHNVLMYLYSDYNFVGTHIERVCMKCLAFKIKKLTKN